MLPDAPEDGLGRCSQELNLRAIGAILEVSESRVCQIHGQAVLRVCARLDKWFNDA